jgi:hypothetical protein
MKKFLIFVGLMMLLAGCQGGGSSSPTAIPAGADSQDSTLLDSESMGQEDVEQSTPVPSVRQPLPPTWTPTPRADDVGGLTSENSAQGQPTVAVASGVRAEWTPVFEPTYVPECTNFIALEPQTRDLLLRDGATVAWSPMTGTALYRFVLFDEEERPVLRELLYGTSFEIAPGIFPRGGIYGWSVEALDSLGFPMCPPRGDYFIVEEF